jgi:hypothetical protein
MDHARRGPTLAPVHGITAAMGARLKAGDLIAGGSRRTCGALDVTMPAGSVQVKIGARQALVAADGLDLGL